MPSQGHRYLASAEAPFELESFDLPGRVLAVARHGDRLDCLELVLKTSDLVGSAWLAWMSRVAYTRDQHLVAASPEGRVRLIGYTVYLPDGQRNYVTSFAPLG